MNGDMEKRDFLKNSGVFLTSSLLSRFAKGQSHIEPEIARRTNWSGNYAYRTERLFVPKTTEEVQQVVKSCNKLRALGTRHSFNGIADSSANQISLMHLKHMALDTKARTVTVGAGVVYGELGPYLDHYGYALHNLASLPQISVAGACATATHGSGNTNGNLSTAVAGMEIVTANGEIVTFSRERDGDRFPGTVVGLGALGMVTSLTLRVQPTYQVTQVVYQNMSMDHLQHHLDEIFGSGYSVSLFTDWQHHRINEVWIKRKYQPGYKVDLSPEFFGAKIATQKLHPIAGHDASSCTDQMGIPGPWYDRLPHFRMGFVPSSGAELQTEYFVPRSAGYKAILAVEELRDQITPLLFVSELRTIAADDLWMSPCYQQDSMTLHFTWKRDWPAVKEVLPQIEAKLAPFQPRPHWAKLFTMPPSIFRPQYRKLPDFEAMLNHHDPAGKFRNQFLRTDVYGA